MNKVPGALFVNDPDKIEDERAAEACLERAALIITVIIILLRSRGRKSL
jgi:hypothetical protein